LLGEAFKTEANQQATCAGVWSRRRTPRQMIIGIGYQCYARWYEYENFIDENEEAISSSKVSCYYRGSFKHSAPLLFLGFL
jgi:hypothetical protein